MDEWERVSEKCIRAHSSVSNWRLSVEWSKRLERLICEELNVLKEMRLTEKFALSLPLPLLVGRVLKDYRGLLI